MTGFLLDHGTLNADATRASQSARNITVKMSEQ